MQQIRLSKTQIKTKRKIPFSRENRKTKRVKKFDKGSHFISGICITIFPGAKSPRSIWREFLKTNCSMNLNIQQQQQLQYLTPRHQKVPQLNAIDYYRWMGKFINFFSPLLGRCCITLGSQPRVQSSGFPSAPLWQ